MPERAINGNLGGTAEDSFTLGNDEAVGISRDVDGNLQFFDKNSSWDRPLQAVEQVRDTIPENMTYTVLEGYQHQVFESLTIDGEYVVEGTSVIF